MKGSRKFVIILLVSLSATHAAFAQKQGQAAIDSLLHELPKQKEDTNKVKLLYSVSANYRRINPDEGIKYGQQALDLATKLAWISGIGSADNCIGGNYINKSNYAKALEYCQAALKKYQECDSKKGIANAAGSIGTAYYYQSDFDKALEYYFMQLKTGEEIDYKNGVASACGNIGNIYVKHGEYIKALEFLSKTLKMFEEMNDKSSIANASINLGNVYKLISNNSKALEYYFIALKNAEETGDKHNIAIINGNIGIIYADQKDYAKAQEYYFKALKTQEETGDKNGVGRTTEFLAALYEAKGDYSKSVECLFKALKINEEIGSKIGVASATGNIGSLYSQEKNFVSAIEYERKALKLSEEIGDKGGMATELGYLGQSYLLLVTDTAAKQGIDPARTESPEGKYIPDGSIPAGRAARLRIAIDYLNRSLEIGKETHFADPIRKAYQCLAMAYKANGDFKKALEASDNFQVMNDSAFSKENNEKIVKMSMKNEYDQKRLADSLRANEKEHLSALELNKQRNYTYLGFAGILLLAGFSFFIVKERGKSEKERKKSDDLLLNILPVEVANELKQTGTTTAKHFDHVTVLFTDFVNFTSAGERLSPQALIDELHTCFKAFDDITGKYHIEKIKTIGDAYLAVAGLPTADPKHAENAVRAAIEISKFMENRRAKLGNSTFEIRVGLHTGNVVAGIVGVKKFAYDIWGDTVNTAARMEQHSEPGKINISQTTYELVKDKFTCEYRGEVEAKNKGALKMYFCRYS